MTQAPFVLPDWLLHHVMLVLIVLAAILVVVLVLAARELHRSASAKPAPPPKAPSLAVSRAAPAAAPDMAPPSSPVLGAGQPVRTGVARLLVSSLDEPRFVPNPRTVAGGGNWLDRLLGRRRGLAEFPLLVVLGGGREALVSMLPNSGHAAHDLAGSVPDALSGDSFMLPCPEGGVVAFSDGLLASERRDERWKALIGDLMRRRAERPFDGLVVVVPISDLQGPARMSDDDIVVLGERLYHLVLHAQRTGGWRVPIYLVLSGCEALGGFEATVAALNAPASRILRAPMGWAVPYALGSAFERSWVREGVDALASRLSILQSRLLLLASNAQAAEQMLLYPQSVAALQEPLTLLLTPMLRPSAYHEAFMFRGFYLTGRTASQMADTPDAFAGRLFAECFFPEHALAQPARGAMTRRLKRVRLAQLVLILLLIISPIGMLKVRDRTSDLTTVWPLVQELADLGERFKTAAGVRGPLVRGTTASVAGAAAAATTHVTAIETQRLLTDMGRVSLNHLATPWAPLSYISEAEPEVERAIRAGFEAAVMHEVSFRLQQDIPALLDLSAGSVPNAPGASGPVDGIDLRCTVEGGTQADVDQLQRLAPRLVAYAKQLANYETLTDDPQIDEVRSLLEFALAVRLTREFSSNNNLYLSALNGAVKPPLQIDLVRRTTGRLVDTASRRAFSGATSGSVLGLALERLVASGRSSQVGLNQGVGLGQLREFQDALHAVLGQIALPENAWLREGGLPPGIAASLDNLSAVVTTPVDLGISPIEASLPDTLREVAQTCSDGMRARLLSQNVFDTVPVFVQVNGRVQLSPQLLQLTGPLDLFLAQPIASAHPNAEFLRLPTPGVPLLWDVNDLQILQSTVEQYLNFADHDLPPTLPAEFRNQIWQAAGEQLTLLTGHAAAHAGRRGADQTRGPAALHDEISRFADAAPILVNLTRGLREAGQARAMETLDQLLTQQAVRLLGQVDGLLISADPYQLADRRLAFWNGTPPLAAMAFGAASLPDLIGSLPARRDYVETLAREDAAPLLTYLTHSSPLLRGPNTALINRWSGIIETLDSYHHNVPANALSRLEQLISADLDRVDFNNCAEFAAATIPGADWFSQQIGTIRAAVVARCGGAIQYDTIGRYDEIAEAFNASLAGRFPFGPLSAPDADPAEVKSFFTRFGSDLPTLRKRIAGLPVLSRSGAGEFVTQLAEAQAALAPMLTDPVPDAPLTYDVDVDFRTNIGADPGANQIIEETLRFGTQSLSSFSSSKRITWGAGNAVEVLLRWAKNAPSVPSSEASGTLHVHEQTASYITTGPWSLLRMLTAQRPAPAMLAQLSDRRAEPVGFMVPLKRNPDALGGPAPDISVARIFMRIALSGVQHSAGQPDRRTTITISRFPSAAPRPLAPAKGLANG